MDDYISNGKKKDKFNPIGSDWLMGSAGNSSDSEKGVSETHVPSQGGIKFTSNVKIEFTGNEFTAESKEEYIQKVIESFKEEFDIDIDESEIHDIEEV